MRRQRTFRPAHGSRARGLVIEKEKDFETGLSLLQDIHQAACVLWLGRRGLGCRGRARQGDRRLVALPQGHPESTGQLELESAASKKVDEPEKNLKKHTGRH